MKLRLRALLQLVAATPASALTAKLKWTSDLGYCDQGECAHIGPDGPWQALVVSVGSDLVDVHMWPAGGYSTEIVTSSSGGDYDPEESTSSNRTDAIAAQSDPWLSTVFLNSTVEGPIYNELLELSSGDLIDSINATIVAAETWEVPLQNGKKRNNTVGNLGLGVQSPAERKGGEGNIFSVLWRLKVTDKITSRSYGLHMGSVPLGQPGSMVLGGYEKNRALGDVGVFDLIEGVPKAFLSDLVLGVETGSSPFEKTGSVWRGLEDSETGADVTKANGGKANSAMIVPNPVSPYIYLPPGNCEAVADQLPVTWDEGLRLFLWDKDDKRFERIVNSPAYLAFVLSDRNAANVTVKVPFKLLNLTLEEPLVDTPTPYFPCQSMDSEYGAWQLGRAFLQAAFLGLNYEQESMYLAQAPGPDLDQSVIRTIELDDDEIETNDADSFEKTWRSTWKPLGDNDKVEDEDDGGQGLSTGAIAGIVVGAVVGVVLLLAGLWFCWRKRHGKNEHKMIGDPTGVEHADNGLTTMHEVHDEGRGMGYEVPGGETAYEMPGSEPLYEADGTSSGYDRTKYR